MFRLVLFAVYYLCCIDFSQATELRSFTRDGSNAAVLLAGICGEDVKKCLCIESDSHNSRPNSLFNVRNLAAELSCATQIRKINFADLIKLGRPAVVVLCKSPKIHQGKFCVVLNATKGSVTIVSAGEIVVQNISGDEFRRCWTGHALIPVKPQPTGKIAISLTVGCMLFILTNRFILAKPVTSVAVSTERRALE